MVVPLDKVLVNVGAKVGVSGSGVVDVTGRAVPIRVTTRRDGNLGENVFLASFNLINADVVVLGRVVGDSGAGVPAVPDFVFVVDVSLVVVTEELLDAEVCGSRRTVVVGDFVGSKTAEVVAVLGTGAGAMVVGVLDEITVTRFLNNGRIVDVGANVVGA